MGLVLEKVTKRFAAADTDTLRDVDLTVRKGEFICLIGPSGCGKTTLLNIIAGLETPSEGRVVLDGVPIERPGPDRVVLFQEDALFPWLTVIENVKFGLKLAGKTKAQQEEAALHYLRMVQLAHFRDYRPHQLSGGMKQRAALARSLAMESKILLMDEPFAALDKQTKNKLREEVEALWSHSRFTALFVTHSVEEAVFFADRIIMMGTNPGRIIKEFDIDFPRPRQIEARGFISLRAEILHQVRKEVEKNAEKEYRND